MPVYLLHFDRPYKHARHYLGFAETMESLSARILTHQNATPGDGQHHRLMQVIRTAGIGFQVARIWPHATRADERKMKQHGHTARRCPLCKGVA